MSNILKSAAKKAKKTAKKIFGKKKSKASRPRRGSSESEEKASANRNAWQPPAAKDAKKKARRNAARRPKARTNDVAKKSAEAPEEADNAQSEVSDELDNAKSEASEEAKSGAASDDGNDAKSGEVDVEHHDHGSKKVDAKQNNGGDYEPFVLEASNQDASAKSSETVADQDASDKSVAQKSDQDVSRSASVQQTSSTTPTSLPTSSSTATAVREAKRIEIAEKAIAVQMPLLIKQLQRQKKKANQKPKSKAKSQGTSEYASGGGMYDSVPDAQSSTSSTTVSVATSSMTVDTAEEMEIRCKLEAQYGIARHDVQASYDGGDAPEPKAMMQRDLRMNAKFNHDDGQEEDHRTKQKSDVKRGKQTGNEEKSKGWALIAMKDEYKAYDKQKGQEGQNLFRTKYLFDEAANLEGFARTLGSEQAKGREKTIIRMLGGKWTDITGQAVDTEKDNKSTSSIAFNERQAQLTAKLEQARREQDQAEDDDPELTGLEKRIASLKEKMTSANIWKHRTVSGKYIYVMNAAGELFAAESKLFVIHHSSFLAGGAVAGAGDIGINGGVASYISNSSGHYRPGPAYLWQVVQQLKMRGAPMGPLHVNVMGVPTPFKNGDEFLQAMDPVTNGRWFDSTWAIDALKTKAQDLKAARKKAEQPGDAQVRV